MFVPVVLLIRIVRSVIGIWRVRAIDIGGDGVVYFVQGDVFEVARIVRRCAVSQAT